MDIDKNTLTELRDSIEYIDEYSYVTATPEDEATMRELLKEANETINAAVDLVSDSFQY